LLLTGVGLFGMILPTLGLMQPVAEISYTYGYEFEQQGEILFPTDARTYRALNQFWFADDPGAPRTKVYVNDAEQTTGFRIDRTEGTVIFEEPLATGSIVTADYVHKLPWEIRDGVAMIATHLLGEREQQARGMTGVKSLKVAEVTITNSDDKIASSNLAYIEPEAAWLLDGFKYITVR
jgi:hypothetical protein